MAVNSPLAHSTREAFADYLASWANEDFSAEVKGRPAALHAVVGGTTRRSTPTS